MFLGHRRITIERLQRILSDWTCPECGEIRIPTPSGACCPNHKLIMGVEPRDRKLVDFVREVEALPVADFDKSTGCWMLMKHGLPIDGEYVVRAELFNWHVDWLKKMPPVNAVIDAKVISEEYIDIRAFVPLRYLMAAL